MMRRLNRYLGRSVLFATLGALVVLVFILFISILISELQALKGSYTLNDALLYTFWQMPQAIYETLTFAAFLGCVVGLGMHASANELVIVRAAGVSIKRIMWIAMRPILILTAIGLLWGEYVTPISLRLAEGVKASSQADSTALASQTGVWYLENNTFQYFSGINRKLYGVTRYQLDENRSQLVASSFASEATYYNTGWLLENGKESRFRTLLQNGEVDKRYMEYDVFANKRWNTELSPSLLNDLVLPTEALSTLSLYRYAKSRDHQGLESQEFWLAFWQKVSQPLVVVSLALVGISFIFGSLRESSMGLRITIAVLVGIVFTILQEFAAASSLVFSFSPFLAVLVPILFSAGVGLWMLRGR